MPTVTPYETLPLHGEDSAAPFHPRLFAIARRADENLDPVVFPVTVRFQIAGKKQRRHFASHEEFARYRTAYADLTTKFEKTLTVEHPVPLAAWQGGDLHVVLGHLESLLPRPSQTIHFMEFSISQDFGLANVWIDARRGNAHHPARTWVSLANGSGFRVRAELPGMIPKRALVALAEPPCEDVRVELVFIRPETFSFDRGRALPEVRERAEAYAARRKARSELPGTSAEAAGVTR